MQKLIGIKNKVPFKRYFFIDNRLTLFLKATII
nr:MAG TPA: hypothetical protein [Bacteriophage sp.]